jgi:hypothetical protein
MLKSQDQAQPLYCPRCGGVMYKPSGSTLYWHADNNHPPCSITNLAEVALSTHTADAETPKQSLPQDKRPQHP